MNYKKCFAGFTMAEVLITIGIIGVVAAMTFPALVMHHRNKALESQFKNIIHYSVRAQVRPDMSLAIATECMRKI